MNHPDKIIIHGTDVSYATLKNQLNSVDNYHRSQDFPKSRLGYYVGYHVLITNGVAYQCKYDTETGAHTVGENNRSLGVCVGFDGDIEYPHPEDYILLKRQVKNWQRLYSIPDSQVYYHRAFNTNKTCPGSLLGVEWMKNLLAEPETKPADQEEKQKEILIQKISLLQRLISLYLQLKLK